MKTFINYLTVISTCFCLTGCFDALATPDDTKPVPVVDLRDPSSSSNTTQSHNGKISTVALLLPLQGDLAGAGTAIRDGFTAAEKASDKPSSSLKLVTIDTTQTSNMQTAYEDALKQGADMIVGPLQKDQVQQLSDNMNLPVPTLALNYLDPNKEAPEKLYQFGLSPLDEARQAAALAAQQGKQSALIIAPQGRWGETVTDAFQDQWQAVDGKVVGHLFYQENSSDLTQQLTQLLKPATPSTAKSTDTDADADDNADNKNYDVIFLAANPTAARQILSIIKSLHVTAPIYATSLVYSGAPQPTQDKVLDNVTFCDVPWVIDSNPHFNDLKQQLVNANNQQNTRLFALGVDAFQIVNAMATSDKKPSFNGATGVLYLNDQHRVVRQLECAQFQNGVPVAN